MSGNVTISDTRIIHKSGLGHPPRLVAKVFLETNMCVNLGLVRKNYRISNALSPNSECAAIVKGDAYGYGLISTSQILIEEGAKTFFVATLEEC